MREQLKKAMQRNKLVNMGYVSKRHMNAENVLAVVPLFIWEREAI